MMLRMLICVLAPLSLSACVSAPTQDPTRLPGGAWALDPAHSSTLWQVRHMGLSWYTGRFDNLDARLDFDPARPEQAQLTAIISANSISTGDPEFDETLCGGGWFACEVHPQIVFTSDRIEITGENTGLVHGQLQIRGVSHPVILETQFYGGVFNPLEGRQALGFSANTTIDRTDFGVGRLPGNLIGDTVRIHIEAEFLRARQE